MIDDLAFVGVGAAVGEGAERRGVRLPMKGAVPQRLRRRGRRHLADACFVLLAQVAVDVQIALHEIARRRQAAGRARSPAPCGPGTSSSMASVRSAKRRGLMVHRQGDVALVAGSVPRDELAAARRRSGPAGSAKNASATTLVREVAGRSPGRSTCPTSMPLRTVSGDWRKTASSTPPEADVVLRREQLDARRRQVDRHRHRAGAARAAPGTGATRRCRRTPPASPALRGPSAASRSGSICMRFSVTPLPRQLDVGYVSLSSS